MLTTSAPGDWKALQADVAQILEECGFAVQVEKHLETIRGSVEIDVWAEELVAGRPYTLFCECKHWSSNVPQGVIHAFRTVVADSGANVGYIISSSGFQSGAFSASDLTNIRLLTWDEFQEEFTQTWVENYLLVEVTRRFDRLFSYTEPLANPRQWDDLTEEGQKAFVALHFKYGVFGALMMMFTPYASNWVTGGLAPELPIRSRMKDNGKEEPLPDEVLDARGYRDFLDAATSHWQQAEAEFRAALTTTK
jgi:restriction system protein